MRKSSRKIILAMLLSILLTGCGCGCNKYPQFIKIKWIMWNTHASRHDGEISLKPGYVITSCNVDYENNIVVMNIEKE